MTARARTVGDGLELAGRIRSEYGEMPGLSLTIGQAARLWQLDQEHCTSVLEHLAETGFLRHVGGRYRRAAGGV